jgi:hypothetical protein
MAKARRAAKPARKQAKSKSFIFLNYFGKPLKKSPRKLPLELQQLNQRQQQPPDKPEPSRKPFKLLKWTSPQLEK